MTFVKINSVLMIRVVKSVSDKSVVEVFNTGGIIAYPTEAVFGLGCDPDNEKALNQLLLLKDRPAEKGLILLAGSYEQLLPYIDVSNIAEEKLATIIARWPDGTTQLLPKKKTLSPLLSGIFDTIAVRITSQSDVVKLCHQVGKPIVSTSANFSGLEPAKTWQTLDVNLLKKVDYLVKGNTLGHTSPSTIINALTGKVIRD